MDYGVPGGFGGRGVVYNSFQQDGAVSVDQALPDTLRDCLLDSGITQVICGHQPHGDSPLVIKSRPRRRDSRRGSDFGSTAPAGTGTSEHVTVVTADTSYSDQTDTVAKRGKALCEVVFTVGAGHKGTESSPELRVHGALKTGEEYDFCVLEDSFVGRGTDDGTDRWVKAKLPGGEYHMSHGPQLISTDMQYSREGRLALESHFSLEEPHA
jgi:hypothetical protein